MYTRCPSCRSEISFEPPANMEALPDGYKHRIKCPCCGVTIGVKINKVDTAVVQPTYVPYNPQPQAINQAPYAGMAEVAPVEKANAKKTGVCRNVFMMIFSLLFVAISVLGYLVNTGVLDIDFLYGLTLYDGITMWANVILETEAVAAIFELDILAGILSLFPMILFTLAGINFIVAFISACGKKFSRAWNFIASILIGGLAIVTLFLSYFMVMGEVEFFDYFLSLVDDFYLALVGAGLGLIQLFAGIIISLVSMKNKRA